MDLFKQEQISQAHSFIWMCVCVCDMSEYESQMNRRCLEMLLVSVCVSILLNIRFIVRYQHSMLPRHLFHLEGRRGRGHQLYPSSPRPTPASAPHFFFLLFFCACLGEAHLEERRGRGPQPYPSSPTRPSPASHLLFSSSPFLCALPWDVPRTLAAHLNLNCYAGPWGSEERRSKKACGPLWLGMICLK